MKIRDKNPITRRLIAEAKKASPVWAAVAKGLNRPRRQAYEVTLTNIERHTTAKDVLVVPGKVLATGSISKPLQIAALQFSANARQQIENAGGTTMTIPDMMKANPKGKGVKVFG